MHSSTFGATQDEGADIFGQTDPSLIRTFRGHKDKITQVIFNPNLK